jgi:hypothetical protein
MAERSQEEGRYFHAHLALDGRVMLGAFSGDHAYSSCYCVAVAIGKLFRYHPSDVTLVRRDDAAMIHQDAIISSGHCARACKGE